MKGEYLHREHSILAPARDGTTVLVIAHADDSALVTMCELEPGFFAVPAPEPRGKGEMGVRIEIPGPGQIRHAYCWTDEAGAFIDTDISDLHLVR